MHHWNLFENYPLTLLISIFHLNSHIMILIGHYYTHNYSIVLFFSSLFILICLLHLYWKHSTMILRVLCGICRNLSQWIIFQRYICSNNKKNTICKISGGWIFFAENINQLISSMKVTGPFFKNFFCFFIFKYVILFSLKFTQKPKSGKVKISEHNVIGRVLREKQELVIMKVTK